MSTTVEFKGGRKPVDHTKPKLMLLPHLLDSYNPPPSVDYLSRITDWPMYQNDVCGDCTIATVGHALQAVSTYGVGEEVRLTEDEILNKYVALSGYNPQTGENDTGLIVQDVLNDWRKVGYYDPEGCSHKSLIFAWVDPDNLNAVRSAINIFGWVYLGANITQGSMYQFNAGEPWDISGEGDYTEILGGHAIPCGAYREDGEDGSFAVITWGKIQLLTEKWFRANVDECWVVITSEWLSKDKRLSPSGLDLHGLGKDYARLTGGVNPFPEPIPEFEPEEPEPPIALPEFRFPTCAKHFFKKHRWWCKKCDIETERQMKEVCEELWRLQSESSN